MSKSKTRLSQVSVRRLLRVGAAILAEPKLYNQASFEVCKPHTEHDCGTPGCIVGWANTLFREPSDAQIAAAHTVLAEANIVYSDPYILLLPVDRALVAGAARLHLGAEVDKLWTQDAWPSKYQYQYINAPRGSKKQARVAYNRIKHFIRTDGAE